MYGMGCSNDDADGVNGDEWKRLGWMVTAGFIVLGDGLGTFVTIFVFWMAGPVLIL